jgi:hypothetical protein
MGIEATRICFIAIGGCLAAFLAVAPRLACRLYAEALVNDRDRAAGFWAFLAAGAGSGSR